MTPSEVLEFWFGKTAATFEELKPQMMRWFRGGPDMDHEVITRFSSTVEEAFAGGLDAWEATEKGWLALVIVLDQFTRNVLRDVPRMYAGDPRAQRIAVAHIDSGAEAMPFLRDAPPCAWSLGDSRRSRPDVRDIRIE